MQATDDACTLQYARTLSRMVQAETVSAAGVREPEKFRRFHALLRELFPHIFAAAEVEDFDGSLLLRWPGRGEGQPLLLMSHHDVVAASGDWKYPPFSGEIAEGRVWGRGTLDTKNNLWAMLQAMDELAAEGVVPARDIYLESACTEETDGSGADKISAELERRGIRFFLSLDEGGMMTCGGPTGESDRVFAMAGVAEKATYDLKFTARGHGGHASTPGKDTPLVRLGRFMAAVEDADLFSEELSPATEEMLRRMAPEQEDETRRFLFEHARALLPLLRQAVPGVLGVEGAMLKTTIAFTMCQGSGGSNVLPQEAYAIGNMRVSHHQGAQESIRRISELAARFDIETEVVRPGFESNVTDIHGEAFQAFERAVAHIFPGVTVLPYLMTAGSDSRYFSRVCDSCIRFAPFLIDGHQTTSIHGVNENISLSTLCSAVDFYRYIIQTI